MKISKNENKIKTVFNIYEPLIPLMKSKLDEACLKRDVYLDKALLCESDFLRKEVTTPNSVKAKNYILKSLKELELKPVNLLLSKETVDLMNEVCKEKNIPRDAFVNRVFLLLIASNMVIDALFFGLFKKHNPDLDFEFWGMDWDEWANNIQLQHYQKMYRCFDHPNIFASIEEFVNIDPFWRLRDYFSCYEKDWKLYGHPFEKDALSNLSVNYGDLRVENTIGFNTFISDDDIPKQEVHYSEVNNIKAKTDSVLATMEQEEQERQAKIGQLKKRKGQNEHD